MQVAADSKIGQGTARVLDPPSWVTRLVAHPSQPEVPIGPLTSIDETRRGDFARITVRIRSAESQTPEQLRELTREAYRAIAARLAACQTRYPIRFWNLIPGINTRVAPGVDRYMMFNAGRFMALEQWFGGRARFDSHIATASGIGHRGDDLIIHCLASSVRGIPLENPRQVPSYCYSSRYGPLPPSFARATIFPGTHSCKPLLLIGGTASICGEHSKHIDDLDGQLRETFANLRSLVTAAGTRDETTSNPPEGWHTSFQSLRVYYRDCRHRLRIIKSLRETFGNVEFEYFQADLCRPELLVEIEGVAEFARNRSPVPTIIANEATIVENAFDQRLATPIRRAQEPDS